MPPYFAYGSNLDPEQLADREVDFANPRRGRLRDWKLVFNKVATLHAVPGEGRANIVPARGRIVEGVLFEVGADAIATLDWYEGATSGHYRRTEVEIAVDDGPNVAAVCYVAEFIGTGLQPSPWYLGRILNGARHFGLSRAYVAALERTATAGPATRPVR